MARQRLIDGVSRSMAEDFFKRFDQEMQRRYPAPTSQASGADSSAPAHASTQPTHASAARTIPSWLWILVAGAIAAAAFWLLR